MRKALVLVLLFVGFSLSAGDVASFVNMGFSNDGRYYMFGQKGVEIAKAQSYADAYIIDIKENNYAKGGVFSTTEKSLPSLGADDVGILFNIVKDNAWVIKKYDINHNNSGKSIYFLATGASPENNLSFRVFDKSSKIKEINCALSQTVNASAKRSSFFITVNLKNQDGVENALIAGNSKIVRKNTGAYFIKNILLSPDNKSIVFVIGKEVYKNGEKSVNYMVETVALE